MAFLSRRVPVRLSLLHPRVPLLAAQTKGPNALRPAACGLANAVSPNAYPPWCAGPRPAFPLRDASCPLPTPVARTPLPVRNAPRPGAITQPQAPLAGVTNGGRAGRTGRTAPPPSVPTPMAPTCASLLARPPKRTLSLRAWPLLQGALPGPKAVVARPTAGAPTPDDGHLRERRVPPRDPPPDDPPTPAALPRAPSTLSKARPATATPTPLTPSTTLAAAFASTAAPAIPVRTTAGPTPTAVPSAGASVPTPPPTTPIPVPSARRAATGPVPIAASIAPLHLDCVVIARAEPVSCRARREKI